MASETVVLEDQETVSDLSTFFSRARSIEDGAVLLQAAGSALALYVPVLYPEFLGDSVPTVLGMRAVRLGSPAEAGGVYAISALTDRLARMDGTSLELSMPPAQVNASWAGQQVPRGGWEQRETFEDDALLAEAMRGIGVVAQALPENAGKPVLKTVRARIWSSPVEGVATPMPLGMAFGAHALGFLRAGATSTLYSSGPWLRLSCGGGHVVARQGGVLG
ncbi:hypothetical protein [Paeniglutamicibacter sp.]|uniref:hypothetical protein n=1 Tax=Paeniglutamicibacter sp. TaxID=1934391 RepID=UPI00398A4FEA